MVLRKWGRRKNISIRPAINGSSGRPISISKRTNNQLFYSTFGWQFGQTGRWISHLRTALAVTWYAKRRVNLHYKLVCIENRIKKAMKYIIKIWITLTAFTLLFSACKKESVVSNSIIGKWELTNHNIISMDI